MEVDQNTAATHEPFRRSNSASASVRYQNHLLIGEGTYGKVFKATDTQHGNLVALKQIRLETEDEGVPSTALREIALLKELHHPNVVRLHDVLHGDRKLTLIFEYAEQDLKSYMEKNAELLTRQPFVTKFITWQMLHGLTYVHRRRMLHRDLKPQNVLVNSKDTVIKIADFGLARVFGIPVRAYTHEVVTLWYRAPEILLGSKIYSTPVDVWSIGCIMAELACGGKPLFAGENEISQLFRIFQVLGTPTEEMWPGVSGLPDYLPTFPKWHRVGVPKHIAKASCLCDQGMDLLQSMLDYVPGRRVAASQALQHPYFAELGDAVPGVALPNLGFQ